MTATCLLCGEPFSRPGRAKFCPACRPVVRRQKCTKYSITESVKHLLKTQYDGTVRGRIAEIAEELGWSAWAVKRAARKLGLTRGRTSREWTPQEEAVLRRWQGLRSADWLAKQLGRTETSVILKFKRMRLSRRVRLGYTAEDFGHCMGVLGKVVVRWINAGWLKATRRGSARPDDAYQIAEVDILAFLRSHPAEYDLRKVDQDWFLRLVFKEPADQLTQPAHNRGTARVPDPTPAEILERAAKIRQQKALDRTIVKIKVHGEYHSVGAFEKAR